MTNNENVEQGTAPKPFSFSPRDFVHGPYVDCPRCHQLQFGVVAINGRGFSRRSRNCLYPIGAGGETLVHFPLPQLQKKVLYLDQLMISEMMKSLNPQTKAHQQDRVRQEWRIAFEKLDSICKLQLAICPDSSYHHAESYVHQHYAALKRIYELLSHGISFHSPNTIKDAQLRTHVESWLSKSSSSPSLDLSDALPGNAHDWQDRIRVTIKSDYVSDFADDFRNERAKADGRMRALFSEWQEQETRKFLDWYEPEIRDFGVALVEQHDEYIAKQQRIRAGEIQPTSMDFRPPPPVFCQVRMVVAICGEFVAEPAEARALAGDYFRTADFSTLPYVRISALLLAGLARRAAAGQKRPPSRGMVNDINMVATILPYCDAMFLDREIHGLLEEGDIRERLGVAARIFSPSDFGGFFTYLDEIRSSATPDHIDQVREVYGNDCGKPFINVFDIDEETAAPRSD